MLVAGDTERLGRVLSNPLDNALRHTPPEARGVTATSARSEAVIGVTDGKRHPTPTRSGIFDRFHRVDQTRASADGSGSGLGLSATRGHR